MDIAPRKSKAKVDKNPYDRHSEGVTKKAFKSVEQGVKPVARDTNKTRRKETTKRIVGTTEIAQRPAPNLKKAVKKGFKSKYQ